MSGFRDRAIVWSDRLRLPRLFGVSPDRRVTTILFHAFRFGGESWEAARERLRRQLDFLATAYRPVDMAQALRFVQTGGAQGGRDLLVTVDDAKRDILEVFDLFQAFGIPVLQFVCAGWSERAQPDREPDGIKARLVSLLHFHDGPSSDLSLGGVRHRLDQGGNAALIDAVIGADDLAELARIEDGLTPAARRGTICDWSELCDLQRRGMAIGCHSVSHPRIARQSAVRQRFEIGAARRLIEDRLGPPCPWFAYPYGTPESHDAGTHALVREEGFSAAFTTATAFATPGQDSLLLPRIVLPDVPMPDRVFRARVRGGGIPLTRLKEAVS